MKSADFTRKRRIKKIKEKNEICIKNLTDDENDSKKEKEKDLTKLTKLINNINNKLKYFTRLYFDRWNQNIINYKNDENISLTEINKESSIKNQDNITKIANKYLKDWTIDRLSKVDKAILSLGIYELLYTDTPSIVAINEAIILAKKYSDDKVVKMINAALDQVYHNEGKDE